MIVEYTYSEHDLKKKCYKCKWLKMNDEWDGYCECSHNKIKFRNRSITDKKCTWKNADKALKQKFHSIKKGVSYV